MIDKLFLNESVSDIILDPIDYTAIIWVLTPNSSAHQEEEIADQGIDLKTLLA